MMKLTMIGTGYVGLVTGACLAEVGHQVICADIDAGKIDKIEKATNDKELPIYEPGLFDYLQRNKAQGRLSFTADVGQAVQASDIIFICVGTPQRADGSADLRYVWGAARTIGENLNAYKIIVDKSTVPVGTAARVQQIIQSELDKKKVTKEFDVVSNPEFLREGSAIDDFMKPDRIVVGCNSPKAEKIMKKLYQHWDNQSRETENGEKVKKHPVVFMDVASAEMTKYAANAFLATKISFINEIANICEGIGADVDKVREGIGLDSRIGPKFLYPGLGYGGSCFPKDVRALSHSAKSTGYTPRLLEIVDVINQDQRLRFINTILKFFNTNLEDKVLALWGLAFKPDTDDIREAPALTIIDHLLPEVAKLQVHDPAAMKEVEKHFNPHPDKGKIIYMSDPYQALEGADALIINTEWQLFRDANLDQVYDRLKGKVVFDGRNIFDPKTMKNKGFQYFSIGRPDRDDNPKPAA